MTALQKAFSRHEKIRRMLVNLEEVSKGGEVDTNQYTQLKTRYEGLLEAALEDLKRMRTQIDAQRQQAQEMLTKLRADANDISTRVRVGEITMESVTGQLAAIRSRRETCEKNIQQYEQWLAARTSNDVGGYVDVDVGEAIEYRPEPALDWNKMVGNIGERAKGIVAFLSATRPTQPVHDVAAPYETPRIVPETAAPNGSDATLPEETCVFCGMTLPSGAVQCSGCRNWRPKLQVLIKAFDILTYGYTIGSLVLFFSFFMALRIAAEKVHSRNIVGNLFGHGDEIETVWDVWQPICVLALFIGFRVLSRWYLNKASRQVEQATKGLWVRPWLSRF